MGLVTAREIEGELSLWTYGEANTAVRWTEEVIV